MGLESYIAYGAATITVTGFIYAITRKIIKSYKHVTQKLSELESALEIRQSFRIIDDCMVATDSGKLIEIERGVEFNLTDIMEDSNMVKGTIFHDEVTIYIDRNKLKRIE